MKCARLVTKSHVYFECIIVGCKFLLSKHVDVKHVVPGYDRRPCHQRRLEASNQANAVDYGGERERAVRSIGVL